MRLEDGIYAAVAGGRVVQRDFDVLAENLANVDTVGFKRLRPHTAADGFAARLDRARVPGPLPVTQEISIDWRPGPPRVTHGTLDVSIGSDALLAVETPAGVRYTRDGRMTRSADGQLVRIDGLKMLDDGGQPIDLPEGLAAIGRDGTVRVDGAPIARLGTYRFQNPRATATEGEGLYRPLDPDAIDAVADPDLTSGTVEGSNVPLAASLVDMIRLSRTFEAVMHSVTSIDQTLEKKISGG